MVNIEDFIQHQECPGVNGIYYPNGSVHLLDVNVNWVADDKYIVKFMEETSINDLCDSMDIDCWNDCNVLFSKEYDKFGIKVISGESDYGDDGFIAVIDCHDKLVWLAFFDCSNPFDDVSVDESLVYARSTNGTMWEFPISSPKDVVVKC